MNGFLSVLKAETRKLRKRKKYFIFLLIAMGLGVLTGILNTLPALSSEPAINLFSAAGYIDHMFSIYLPLIVFMAANDLIASEIKEKTIISSLVSPVSRTCIYTAKCFSILLFTVVQALIIAAGNVVLYFITDGGISLLPFSYVLFDAIPLFTLIVFACLISLLTHSPAFSMLLLIVSYILLKVLGSFFGISPMLFTSYIPWHSMLHGGLNAFDLLLRIAAVAAPAILFLSAGALTLEGKRF